MPAGDRQVFSNAYMSCILHAIRPPAAICLVAGIEYPSLVAGAVALCQLDGPDQVNFFHLAGLDSYFFRHFFNLFHVHNVPPIKVIIFLKSSCQTVWI
jgi:hypothetical protein